MNFFIALALLSLACMSCMPLPGVNTVLNYEVPEEKEEATVIVPAGMEIISLKYDAELYTTISDGNSKFEGMEGRGFVIAHARHQKTGIHYLLVYEDPKRFKHPKQIIRFQPEEVP